MTWANSAMLALVAVLTLFSLTLATDHVPTVHVRGGTYTGTTANQVDNFFGIPYAQPPVKDLRLRPPQSIHRPFGHLQLTSDIKEVAACVQMDMDPALTEGLSDPVIAALPGHNFTGKYSEDCLTINIQRPHKLPLRPGEKLPVLFWIYGGAWELGTTQWYDSTKLVQKSVAMDEPVLFVAANYRLNAYGFLNGKEVQEAGATNLGLRDQRKALEWVADNIEAFGGDSNRVTIWGESAGAASVFDHLLINNGDHRYKGKALFHGAIMNSGTFINAVETTHPKAQKVFDTFAANAGCSPRKHGKRTLDCLRQVPAKQYQKAMNTLPNFSGPSSNNLAYIRRIDPSSNFLSNHPAQALQRGEFAHVPIISGNLQDEATIFAISSRNIVNSTETLVSYFSTWFPDTPRELLRKYIATYPNSPVAGLPAGTGDKFELYPQYKRNSAIQTDVTFEGGRRVTLQAFSKFVPTWSYIGTYLHLDPDLAQLGTFHTSDLDTQFGLTHPTAGNNMDEAWIHFVHGLDPNGKNCEKPWWPKWNHQHPLLANFSATAVGLTKDNYRKESLDFLAKYGSNLRQ